MFESDKLAGNGFYTEKAGGEFVFIALSFIYKIKKVA
jgi:hypothetical protein